MPVLKQRLYYLFPATLKLMKIYEAQSPHIQRKRQYRTHPPVTVGIT